MRNMVISAGGGLLVAACGFSVMRDWQAWALIGYIILAANVGSGWSNWGDRR